MHTNNTESDTKQTIHRTTQKYIEQYKKYIIYTKIRKIADRAPSFAGFTLAFAL
jgi:hypothetical protein